jgi:AraC-like DNA-binding protein
METYRRIPPAPELAPYVREILVQDSASEPGGEPYTVFPGPCPVLGFQYQGRLAVVRETGGELLSRSGVTGLQTSPRRFQARPDTRTVLVVLEPAAGFLLLGHPMDELAERHAGLGTLVPEALLRPLQDDLPEAGTAQGRAAAVQSFLLSLLRRSSPRSAPHPAVRAMLDRILRQRGASLIEPLVREVGISRRQIERLFLQQVGLGPKRFSALVRFDAVLRRLPEADRSSWADLALDAGYADQPHLIREFTRHAGMSPGRLARASRP